MAGRGPAPKKERFRRNAPARGEWQPSPEGGWQHELPPAPKGLLPATTRIWEGWFRSWWAGHWTLDDVPQLRFIIRLHDRVLRGDVKRLGELRQWLDAYGITPKGQQDRRWERPAPPKPAWSSSPSRLRRLRITPEAEQSGYRHLRVSDDRPSASQRFAKIHAAEREDEQPSARERLAILEGRSGAGS